MCREEDNSIEHMLILCKGSTELWQDIHDRIKKKFKVPSRKIILGEDSIVYHLGNERNLLFCRTRSKNHISNNSLEKLKMNIWEITMRT